MNKVKKMSICVLGGVIAWGLASAEELSMAPGTSHKIHVEQGVKEIVITTPGILRASVDQDNGKDVLIIATGYGQTELRLHPLKGEDIVYQVSVLQDVTVIANQIKELLKDVEGLQIDVVGNKVIFKGDIILKRHWDLKEQVKSAFAGLILDISQVHTGMSAIVAEKIKKEINNAGIDVRIEKDTAVLTGSVYDPEDKAESSRIAGLYAIRVDNRIKIQEVMIETDVYFVQVNSSDAEQFGNNILRTLAVSAGGTATGGSGVSPTLGFSAGLSISARINAFVGAGKAKILAKPHLSTKSGETATFHDGGKIYVPITSENVADLKEIPFGVMLTVKPTLHGKDQVLNEVTIEISTPAADAGVGIVLNTFSTSSTTLTRVGESVLISGLVKQLEAKFKEKTPILGDIPIIKEFFSDRNGRVEETELILVLTPQLAFKKLNAVPLSVGQKHLVR